MNFEKTFWSRLLFPLVIVAIFSACSTPKYTYYFSWYSTQTSASAKTKVSKDVDSLTVVSNVNTEFSPLAIQREVVDANSSNDVVLTTKETKTFDQRPNVTAPDQKGVKKKHRAHKKNPGPTDDGEQDGDKKKNGFAVIGFIFSLGGLIFFPLAYVGIVFSAIGRKSEHPKLAKAGLILGIIGGIFWPLFLIWWTSDSGPG